MNPYRIPMIHLIFMDGKYIDLYELQSRLKAGVESVFPGKVWLKAEISALKARPAGHCYMELSQTSEAGLVAKAQAVIWSSKFRFLAPFFKSVTGSDLSEGMSVLVQVSVNFSQLYGLSLIIDDIDPSFTIGEKEQLRRQTIERLEKAPIKELAVLDTIALPPEKKLDKISVISVADIFAAAIENVYLDKPMSKIYD